MEYTRNELKILWHLKRNRGVVENPDGVIIPMSETLDIRRGTCLYIVKLLEEKCLLVRAFGAPRKGTKAAIVRIELIDPQMYLPPLPAPMPLASVISHENNDLYERTTCEPSSEAVILALVTENEKLRFQINKLQEVVNSLAAENEQLKKQPTRKPRDPGLTQRLQDALPPEVWDSLHHTGRR